mmetsp:Transcript_40813/g.88907  ORF Transcript_40813/g.88907 Transcript_40813/m.88907 type:complete len:234 (-) Transcript_40813:295-996(-)
MHCIRELLSPVLSSRKDEYKPEFLARTLPTADLWLAKSGKDSGAEKSILGTGGACGFGSAACVAGEAATAGFGSLSAGTLCSSPAAWPDSSSRVFCFFRSTVSRLRTFSSLTSSVTAAPNLLTISTAEYCIDSVQVTRQVFSSTARVIVTCLSSERAFSSFGWLLMQGNRTVAVARTPDPTKVGSVVRYPNLSDFMNVIPSVARSVSTLCRIPTRPPKAPSRSAPPLVTATLR